MEGCSSKAAHLSDMNPARVPPKNPPTSSPDTVTAALAASADFRATTWQTQCIGIRGNIIAQSSKFYVFQEYGQQGW